ncbi:MAG: RidA family protein [Planctomycetes bacterium]|nr:RidA family protein [Planctomycetota bacterium]
MRRSTLLCALLLLASCHTTRERLRSPNRTDALPFSNAVTADGLCFLAGTLGVDPATGKPPADPEQEVQLMLDNFAAALALDGLTADDLVSVTVFCPDLTLYETFNKVYASAFTQGFPARAFIGSGPLLRGCRFEIQGIAARR